MKAFQQDLDIIPAESLAGIEYRLCCEGACISSMKKQIKREGELLKEAAGVLEDIQTILFEVRQGELFKEAVL